MNKITVKIIILTTIIATTMGTTIIARTVDEGIFKRLAGNNRLETAIEISKEKNQTGGTIVITNAYNFADALSGSTLCYQENKATVLLTGADTIDQSVVDEISTRSPSKIIILGGTGAVSEYIEATLKSICSNTIRVSGADRYKTAIAIGNVVETTAKSDTVFIAYGENYPDALAASTFAATKGWPILFTGTSDLNEDTATALTTWGIKNAVILGGEGVISSNVKGQIIDMGINVTRIGGANRYDTAKLILNKYYDATFRGLTLCSGENFPDALAGASLASEKNAPIMLVGNSTSDDVKSFIKEKNDRGYIIGGVGVLQEIAMKNLRKGTPIIPTDSTGLIDNSDMTQAGWNKIISTENNNIVDGRFVTSLENGVFHFKTIAGDNDVYDKYYSDIYSNKILRTDFNVDINSMLFNTVKLLANSGLDYGKSIQPIVPYYSFENKDTTKTNGARIVYSLGYPTLNKDSDASASLNFYTQKNIFDNAYATLGINIKDESDFFKFQDILKTSLGGFLNNDDSEQAYAHIVNTCVRSFYSNDLSDYTKDENSYYRKIISMDKTIMEVIICPDEVDFRFTKK